MVSRPGPCDYDDELRLHNAILRRALDWVRGFVSIKNALDRLDPAAAARALARLRGMLAAHTSGDGIWFDSRAWIVTARRR